MTVTNHCLELCYICQDPTYQNELMIFKDHLSVNDLKRISNRGLTPIQVKCVHTFHASCVHDWITTFKNKPVLPSCPYCRTNWMCFKLSPKNRKNVMEEGSAFFLGYGSIVFSLR